MSDVKLTAARVWFVDSFSSLDELTGRDRQDAYKILAVLAKVGRFSCFEVDTQMAGALTRVLHSDWVTTKHSEIMKDEDGYGTHTRDLFPWTYVAITDAGRAALAERGRT